MVPGHALAASIKNPQCHGNRGELLDHVGLWPDEKVLVVNNTGGARLETYVIVGDAGGGEICMNGAAAHLIGRGEEVIIMGFELTDRPLRARVVPVDHRNRFVRRLAEAPRLAKSARESERCCG